MQDVVIAGAVRTPIGTFQGSLSPLSAPDLGAAVIRESLRRARIEAEAVDEIVMGNVLQAGVGQNPARQAAMRAGIPEDIPATTVNMVCGSGLKSVMLAAQAVRAGDAGVLVAGGMESMSNAPYLLPGAREGYRMGHREVVDSMIRDGLWCAFCDIHMGVTAENVANRHRISREDQDRFALRSQMRAKEAMEQGRFTEEIVPVSVPRQKGDPALVDRDEHPRPDTTYEALAKLRPAFQADGTVTAGNSSGINDGAAAMLVLGRDRAEELGVKPMARIVSYASVGLDPSVMGLGPIEATRRALNRAGLSVDDLDLIEANEAFAAQALAVARELSFPDDKLNVNGGAIALGHPIGASGARILVTLLYELERRGGRFGLATLCIGGGQGVAMVVERLSH